MSFPSSDLFLAVLLAGAGAIALARMAVGDHNALQPDPPSRPDVLALTTLFCIAIVSSVGVHDGADPASVKAPAAERPMAPDPWVSIHVARLLAAWPTAPARQPPTSPPTAPAAITTSAGSQPGLPPSPAAAANPPAPVGTPTRPVASLPTLKAGALPGAKEHNGPCDSETRVRFLGTAYLGPSTLVSEARIHWTFSVTAGGSGTDSDIYHVMVRPEGMVALALMYQDIKLPSTAPGRYSITGRYAVSSPDTLPAAPSSASLTIQVTCT